MMSAVSRKLFIFLLIVCLFASLMAVMAFAASEGSQEDCIDHYDILTVYPPNCINPGFTEHYCPLCGESYRDNYVDPTDHDFEAQVIEPDCFNEGYTQYTCKACEFTYYDDYVSTLEHDIKIESTPATCTEWGLETHVCTLCGNQLRAKHTPPIAHDYKTEITASTCIEEGYTTYTCTVCGESYVDDVTELAGHIYKEQLISAPTKYAEGEWLLKCAVCGVEKRTTIPKELSPEQKPMSSYNLERHNYQNYYSRKVYSYLSENGDGSFTRFEYYDGEIIIENYDRNFNYISTRSVRAELELFAGYYSDGNYHFIVFGQRNDDDDDSVEVMRVVKYSSDWHRIDSASVYGVNISVPFEAGNLQMCRVGDYLYVRTARKMHMGSDGLKHQSNYTFAVNIPAMELVNVYWGYVSHSFNQLLAFDGDKLVAVDHGDGYPRAIVINRGNLDEITGIPKGGEELEIIKFEGETGENYTGASVGGFEISDSHYLVAGSFKDYDSKGLTRNIFVAAVSRENFTEQETSIHWITDHEYGGLINVSNPHLVKLGEDSFCLLWTENELLYYVFLNGKGETASEIYTMNAALSDCKPIVSGGKIIWYVTEATEPRFYSIDPRNPTKDDHEHSYYDSVFEPGCTEGGYTQYTCPVCGDSYKESYTEPIGHSWDIGKVTKVPTADAEGEKTFTCTFCGEIRTETIAKLPEGVCQHTFNNKYCIYCGAREPYSELVSINYRRIKIVLDGQEIIPCDGEGKTVEPFIMSSSGTTYLPLRAVSQALGLNVQWDGVTNTVTLKSGGAVKTGLGPAGQSVGARKTNITYRNIRVFLDGEQLSLVNSLGVSVEPFILNSNSSVYLPLRIIGEALGVKVHWDGNTSTVYLNTK